MQKTLKKYYAFFTLPTFIAFAISFIIPFILGIYLSFTRFSTVTDSTWVGLDNYIKAFTTDNDFIHALGFTFSFTVVSVISINIFAFILALLLTRGLRATNFFRTFIFMPNLIGGIVLGYIWQLIINGILYNFEVTITTNPSYGFWGLVVMMNWQLIGYIMIIYIAGIQSIPEEMLDAAAVDGANSMQTLFRIKLPLVMPSITICTFLTLSNSFKMFDQNLSLTAGAPSKQTEMLALNIYNTMYGHRGFEGIGQAKAVIFFIMVALIALVQLLLTRKREVEI